MTVGEKIRTMRVQCGLTQKQLGERAGIAEPTIRKYELGKLNPKIETLKKIADALGVPLSELSPMFPFYKENALPSDKPSMAEVTRRAKENGMTVSDYMKSRPELQDAGETYHGVLGQTETRLRKNALLDAYNTLNDEGQKVAVERVEELTEIPKYQRGGDQESQDKE
jgi:transcriptional regulator with XRE-family HTH domain